MESPYRESVNRKKEKQLCFSSLKNPRFFSIAYCRKSKIYISHKFDMECRDNLNNVNNHTLKSGKKATSRTMICAGQSTFLLFWSKVLLFLKKWSVFALINKMKKVH